MNTFIITYELSAGSLSPRNDDLSKEIEKYENHKRLTNATYAIKTADSPQMIRDKLSLYIKENDALYIISVCKPYIAHIPIKFAQWLEENLLDPNEP
jgi:hypothetical protein